MTNLNPLGIVDDRQDCPHCTSHNTSIDYRTDKYIYWDCDDCNRGWQEYIGDTAPAPAPALSEATDGTRPVSADFQASLDILQSMITAMEPLDIKFPGEYAKRIGVLRVAMASIKEYAMYEATAPVPAPQSAGAAADQPVASSVTVAGLRYVPALVYKCPNCGQTLDGIWHPEAPNVWTCDDCGKAYNLLPCGEGEISELQTPQSAPSAAPVQARAVRLSANQLDALKYIAVTERNGQWLLDMRGNLTRAMKALQKRGLVVHSYEMEEPYRTGWHFTDLGRREYERLAALS